MDKPDLPGYVVLGRKQGANAYEGVVELGFSMNLSPDRVRFWWSTDKAYCNLVPGSFKVDGKAEAEHYRDHFAKGRPDTEFEIFDVHADDLPVEFDWDQWRKDTQPVKTLSGVRNKHGARNVKFEMK